MDTLGNVDTERAAWLAAELGLHAIARRFLESIESPGPLASVVRARIDLDARPTQPETGGEAT
jgi:hypothetical protein